MSANLESVVKQLTDSGIIAPGKLENFVPPKANPQSVDELVAALVTNKHLTQFQAAQVKAGKAKALILGEYTILDKIGAGGMGQVFKAIHRRMDRTVAIKMLPPAMTKDAAALARFEREVRAAARLSHPNIVAAHDAGQSGAAHFLVMEYVEGKDLSVTVKQDGPLPVNKAVNYILQAARGLEYAHSEGIVHRDIKPANLLLDKKGIVKILDMGLARIEQGGGGEQAELTGTGTIMGTVDYMSPEQAISTKNADHRADIYSLGMSLYYLLSGRAAYAGESAMEKLMAHQNQPIPSLQDVQTTVPKQLEAVYKKMVAKRTEQRYQAMSDVVEALEALGYGGSGTLKRGDVASTLDLSSADKQKLVAKAKKKPLGTITEVVASEKSKNVLLKIVGGSFGTIIAPILVFYLIRHLDKPQAPTPPAATVAATSTPLPLGEGGRRPGEGGPAPSADSMVASTAPHPPLEKLGAPSPDGRSANAEPPPAKAPFDAQQAKAYQAAWARHLGTQVETTNSVGMRMTLIPPGKFLMGSTPEQIAVGRKMGEDDKMSRNDGYFSRLADEMPQHKVAISQPLLMGSTEVTVAQFRRFVEASNYVLEAENDGVDEPGNDVLSDSAKKAEKGKDWKNPGYATTDDTAVTQITWNDACAYCAWASEQEQRRPWYRPDGEGGWLIAARADGYRLPTEAEWEYACRAGTTAQYSFGDDSAQLERYGWFIKNAGGTAGKTQPVALKLPNSFGLFDMHGNAQEWCQDWYGKTWYETSSPSDPSGPSSRPPSFPARVLRGGLWSKHASNCRSASRLGLTHRASYTGFRVVRLLDPTRPESAVATTAAPLLPPGEGGRRPDEGVRTWLTPAFQKWIADTQKLPAEKQIEAVSKKLMELNPGFDGKVSGYGPRAPMIENGVVVSFFVFTDRVTDISPVRALTRLQVIAVGGSSPGKGKLFDLSPLEGTRARFIECNNTEVSDLSPLEGTQLGTLVCSSTQVFDLSPLLSCKKLQNLGVMKSKVTAAQVAALQKALPNCKIDWDGAASLAPGDSPGAKAWNTPAFQAWVKATQALPPERQIEAVSKKLMELNPGFDGKLKPEFENGMVTSIAVVTDNVMDVSPLRAFADLATLNLGGSKSRVGIVSDLSPLQGMKLSSLNTRWTQVADLSPLAGMPLAYLNCGGTKVLDLSPLRGMALSDLLCYSTHISDLSPLRGMPLKLLEFTQAPVADLAPLAGMPLVKLACDSTRVADLLPLAKCPMLESLDLRATKVTQAGVAALQKTLPNCKIVWNDPARVAGQASQPWNTPAFQQWVKATQALPAEQQIEAVSKKLMELNPGFDGKVMPTVEHGVVTGLAFVSNNVADLSPMRALARLKRLNSTNGGKKGLLTDLSSLEGVELAEFWCDGSQVSDLSPLRGMPLTKLSIVYAPVFDLSPLAGMKLEVLYCGYTNVSDLSPLKQMPLTSLSCQQTSVADLSPLEGCKKLATLKVIKTKVTSTQVAALQKALPNCKIEWDDPTKAPAKKLAYLDPTFQQWVADTQKLPAEKQIEAVSKKLIELNPGFDGKVTGYGEQGFRIDTNKITDISPVRAWLGLKALYCGAASGGGKLADLSPLAGLSLDKLDIGGNRFTDLSPLAGMPLTNLSCNSCTKLIDLTPLAGMPLQTLNLGVTDVSDLSPLRGLPLKTLTLGACTKLSDISPLKDCKDLTALNVGKTKVTAAQVAALQKALPKCKIEWDDPAKATTPASAPAGKK